MADASGSANYFNWAPAGRWPAQPDGKPAPGDVAIMWINGDAPRGTWDDVQAFAGGVNGIVCEKSAGTYKHDAF